MFVLAHLSDPHLAPLPTPNPIELLSKRGLGYLNWLRKRRRIHRPDVLAAIVADLKLQGADHVAITGDLLNLSLTAEFARSRNWLDALGPSRDVTFVPGNHDSYVRAPHLPARTLSDYGWRAGGISFVRRRGRSP